MRSATRIMLTIVVIAAVTAVATAQITVVKKYVGSVLKKDGTVVVGVVEELSDKSCRVTRAGGIIETIPGDQIKERHEANTPAKQFKQRIANVDKTQAKNLWLLADWCNGKNLKAEEIQCLEELVKLHENSADITNKSYARMAKLRLKLLVKPPPPPDDDDEDDDDGDDDDGDKLKPLTKEEIKEIRWREWTRTDHPPLINRKLIKKFELQNLKRAEQFPALMERQLDEEDKKQIRFRTDVKVLRDFKRRINSILVNHCATQKCHGGPKAKKWRIFRKTQPTTGELYYNFKVIDKYVNRDNARGSLLLRGGLKYDPNDKTHTGGLKDHPAPAIWKSRSDAEYKRIVKWIGSLKFRHGGLMPQPGPPPGWPEGTPWPPRDGPVPIPPPPPPTPRE